MDRDDARRDLAAHSVAGRTVVAHLLGCQLTTLTAGADGAPWLQIDYAPPERFRIRAVGPDGGARAFRRLTQEVLGAEVRRYFAWVEATIFAAGPVAVARRRLSWRDPRVPAPAFPDRWDLAALEYPWFRGIAFRMRPRATPTMVDALYEQAARRARRLLDQPQNGAGVDALATALLACGSLEGATAHAIILRAARYAPRQLPLEPTSLEEYRARLRREEGLE